MAVKGMDVEAGRTSASTLDKGAEQLDGLTTQLTASLTGFDWLGPDADRTRSDWESNNAKQLKMASDALRQFAELIRRQAQEQEQVSA